MQLLTLMAIGTVVGAIVGVTFIAYKIVEEERERREEESMVKVYYKHYNKDGACSECGCLPCQCGS